MLILILRAIITSIKSHRSLALENLALRHQLEVLQRNAKKPQLSNRDRTLWVILSRLWPDWRESLAIVRPKTVVAWHRKGWRLYWRWKCRGRGRPAVSAEVRSLIRRISRENPLWGAPRIHGELLKLGIDVSEATVARYMVKGPRQPSPTWRSFIRNHFSEIAAVDFFTVPTLYVQTALCICSPLPRSASRSSFQRDRFSDCRVDQFANSPGASFRHSPTISASG